MALFGTITLMQPGQTFHPNDSSSDEPSIPKLATEDVSLPEVNKSPTANDQPEGTMQTPVLSPVQPYVEDQKLPDVEPINSNSPEWQYNTSDSAADQDVNATIMPAVEWTASEFIDHDKRFGWFIGLAAVSVLSSGLVYLITRDLVAPSMVLVAAILFGITAGRKPNTLQYRLDNKGVSIAGKQFSYDSFKSFSIIEDGALTSMLLTPLARLATPLTLYFPPDLEDQVLGTLSNYLPHELKNRDPVDKLMRRIRF